MIEMQRRSFIASACAALVSTPTLLRAAPPAANWREDLAILRAAMAIHPGARRYLSVSALERNLERFGAEYGNAAGRGDLDGQYLALARFLATLRCGHSYPNFFNQTKAIARTLFDRPTRLPFNFQWIGTEMVVTADHSGQAILPRGTRITRINGMTPAQVLAKLMPYARADGSNDGKRRSLLSVSGAETIEYFDVFQGLLMPPRGGVHRIAYTTPQGRSGKAELTPMDLAARQATITRVAEDSDGARWTYRVLPSGVAVLDMPGWAMYNSKWDWRSWLSDRLDDAARTRGLIIDLRANEGGNDCGDPILARLVDDNFQPWQFDQRVRFRTLPDILSPHVSTWDDSFRTIGEGGRDLGDGWFQRPGGDELVTIQRDSRRLEVPVAALIGPANSSATFGFASAARKSGRIRLFGETTGGNRRGINGGAYFFTTLPGSGIEFDLPLVGYFPTTPQPDAGLVPDVTIPMTAQTIADGSDPVLTAAESWALRSH